MYDNVYRGSAGLSSQEVAIRNPDNLGHVSYTLSGVASQQEAELPRPGPKNSGQGISVPAVPVNTPSSIYDDSYI